MDLYTIQGNDTIINNPHHDLLRRSSKGSSAQSPEHRLVVTTKTLPRDAAFGFRHGRDPGSLILIGERSDGVSRRQFDIMAKPTGALFIYNRSTNGTMIRFGQEPSYTLMDGSLIPDDQEHLHIMAPVELHIVFYPRAGHPQWERFCAALASEIPMLNDFKLQSRHSTFVTDPVVKRSNSSTQSSQKRRKVQFTPQTAEALEGASTKNSRSSISELDCTDLSYRLLFQPGSQLLSARGGTLVELHQRNNDRAKSVKCLAINQTSLDVRCDLSLPFPCRFYYYPFKDSVEFYNASGSDVTVQSLGRSAPLFIQKECATTLAPGPWKIRNQSGIEFQVLVRPRQYSVELFDASGWPIQSPDISALVEHNSFRNQRLRILDAEQERSFLLRVPFFGSKSMLVCRGTLNFEGRRNLKVLVKFIKSGTGGIFDAAASWEKEYSTLAKLQQSDGILPMLQGDARLGVLLFEDMSAWPIGRSPWCRSGLFTGTLTDAERILQDVTKALRNLEAIHMRHNNIQPVSVLYSREAGAFLMSFESASTFTAKSITRGLQANPWYIAPERSKDKQDVRSDIWSLGILSMALLKLIPLTGLNTLSGWWDIRASATAEGITETGQARWLEIVETTNLSVHEKPHWQAVGMMLQRMLEHDPRKRVSTDTLSNILSASPILTLSKNLARDADQSREIPENQLDRPVQSTVSSRNEPSHTVGGVSVQDRSIQTSLEECDRGIHEKETESQSPPHSPWRPLRELQGW